MIIHIGIKIKSIVNKKGMTVSEFSRRINKSRENVYSIFKRKTIDTGLLATISKVLEYDFFQYYTSLFSDFQKLKDENNTLKEMVKFLQSKKK
ncbi:MAG: helix-turn-helix domain-containing protein [Bacteroidota bacterium]|nr:helix-turn-helix domain-containing protein [Bacteroidota bacterium]